MSHHWFVACPLGLESILEQELRDLGATEIESRRGGARFQGDRSLGERCCLWLRTAIRVQLELAVGEVQDEDDIYDLIRGIEWERFLSVDGTLAVSAAVRDSFLTHSHFTALLSKDAVVDRFRDREGDRPGVDTDDPDLPLRVLLRENTLRVYVDLAGQSLHKRGYREIQVRSPLNEALACGLVMLTEWDRKTPFVDPMCGSGTLPIEAARLAADIAPGLQRTFACERWEDAVKVRWRRLRDEAEHRAEVGLARSDFPEILASDRHPGALELAREGAQRGRVGGKIRFAKCDVGSAPAPSRSCLIVTNPPYGERIGTDPEDLENSWRGLGEFLRACPKDSMAFVLSGDPKPTQWLRLKASARIPVMNGGIDCRLLRYPVGGQAEAVARRLEKRALPSMDDPLERLPEPEPQPQFRPEVSGPVGIEPEVPELSPDPEHGKERDDREPDGQTPPTTGDAES
ncbi:MAG: THUMP domain-containing protein [Planctomycetota bacterium]